MRNIHVLQTDKPSRLYLSDYGKELNLSGYPLRNYTTGQHVYITSDEEIKDGDWCMSLCDDESYEEIYQCKDIGLVDEEDKKIILTTDGDLIKNGVQAIDDEFLKWFVENPSCEEAKVEITEISCIIPNFGDVDKYRITIPNTITEQIRNEEKNKDIEQPTLTSEEFFRKKLKELNPLQSSVTLSREMITAEQGMIWAKEYSDYINKQEKR